MLQSANQEKGKSGTHNLRQDTGEPHQMILVHVAMEQVAMRWWIVEAIRADMLGVKCRSVRVQNAVPTHSQLTD